MKDEQIKSAEHVRRAVIDFVQSERDIILTEIDAAECFRRILTELGFAKHKPNQMTNSDYWMVTSKAMEQFAAHAVAKDREVRYPTEQRLKEAEAIVRAFGVTNKNHIAFLSQAVARAPSTAEEQKQWLNEKT